MTCTNEGRWKSVPFRVPPAVGQFSHDSGGRALVKFAFGFVHNGGGGSSDGCHIFQQEEPRLAIGGDPHNLKK
jgi:hypothetical protein